MRFFRAAVGIFVALTIGGVAKATPLAMSYTVTPALGAYHYDFVLKLDNNDNSWSAGNKFDWIIFGDRSDFGQPSGFETDFFNFVTTDPISLTFTGGGHQGPTLAYGESVTLPGWAPTAVGQFLAWSGDSNRLLPSGTLYWSNLVSSDGAVNATFALATESAVPEPAVWALMIGGFGMVGVTMRRRAVQTTTVSA